MSADIYFTTPERIDELHAIRDRHKGESSITQAARLLAALREVGNVTTFEAMRYLDIFDPRPRKLELVRQGHNVITSWRVTETEARERHRIGVYTLVSGAQQALTA